MGSIRGFVDSRRRPMISVTIISNGDAERDGRASSRNVTTFLALIDTGFNGELWMGQKVAQALEVRATSVFAEAELADGRVQIVRAGSIRLSWLGQRRETAVFIAPRDHGEERRSRIRNTMTGAGEQYVSSRPGEAVALVGTGLIHPNRLVIDFLDAAVTIGQEP